MIEIQILKPVLLLVCLLCSSLQGKCEPENSIMKLNTNDDSLMINSSSAKRHESSNSATRFQEYFSISDLDSTPEMSLNISDSSRLSSLSNKLSTKTPIISHLSAQLNKKLLTSLPPNTILEHIKAKPAVNSAIDAILVVVAIQTMLGLGCTMDISLIGKHILKPSSIAIAAACQFGFMPFIAFSMAKIFALNNVAALAVLVTGCCPGGNLSNLLTYFLYGDINLSILMSTASTLMALVFMPLCLFIYGSNWIAISAIGKMIPFGGVVLTLILTLFPVGVGIAIKARYEKVANTILKISLFSVAVSFIALMTLSIILFGSSVFTAISPTTYVIAFIMPLIGYGSGFLLAAGFGLPDASKRTVAIETGCQNSQLSSTILKMAFASETMGAYFLFPMYYALFQGLEGVAMILVFRAYRHYYASEAMVPTSRVTYDKFGESWDGEDGSREAELYQKSCNSSEQPHGKLSIGEADTGEVRSQPVPNQLPLKHTFSPDHTQTNKKHHKGDKSSLIPYSSDQRAASGRIDYGGLN